MNLGVIALTKNGYQIALQLREALPCDLYLNQNVGVIDVAAGAHIFERGLAALIAELWDCYDGFIMIMATGIAVRTCAPHIKDKRFDPAVVVVDEQGAFAISLLSGHLGGANALAKQVADLLGACPVITTATDIQQKPAFDLIAQRNHCLIENNGELKYISGALVNGGQVVVACTSPVEGDWPQGLVPYEGGEPSHLVVISNRDERYRGEHVLYVRPRNLVLGIGCRRGTAFTDLASSLREFMDSHGYCTASLSTLVSLDIKATEPGLIELAQYYHIPFTCYTAAQLRPAADQSTSSSFVEETTGTASVAEAAVRLAAAGGKVLVGKTVYPGMTMALGERNQSIVLTD